MAEVTNPQNSLKSKSLSTATQRKFCRTWEEETWSVLLASKKTWPPNCNEPLKVEHELPWELRITGSIWPPWRCSSWISIKFSWLNWELTGRLERASFSGGKSREGDYSYATTGTEIYPDPSLYCIKVLGCLGRGSQPCCPRTQVRTTVTKRRANRNITRPLGVGQVLGPEINTTGSLLTLEESRTFFLKSAKETRHSLSVTGRRHGKGKHHFKDTVIQCLLITESGSWKQRSVSVLLGFPHPQTMLANTK